MSKSQENIVTYKEDQPGCTVFHDVGLAETYKLLNIELPQTPELDRVSPPLDEQSKRIFECAEGYLMTIFNGSKNGYIEVALPDKAWDYPIDPQNFVNLLAAIAANRTSWGNQVLRIDGNIVLKSDEALEQAKLVAQNFAIRSMNKLILVNACIRNKDGDEERRLNTLKTSLEENIPFTSSARNPARIANTFRGIVNFANSQPSEHTSPTDNLLSFVRVPSSSNLGPLHPATSRFLRSSIKAIGSR